MQNAENAREHLRPRTSPSSFRKHSPGEGASICSSQRGLVGVAQHRNAVCLFALPSTWQSRRASGCSVSPWSPVTQCSACRCLHCANTSGSTRCRQRLLSEVERRHGIAIGAGLHALVPVDAGATEVSAEASRGDARCMPQTLVLGDCRHIRRTSADIVSGFWALPIQSRQSAVLKAHCWHAQAQLTSAWLCRWHPPEESAAHARQPDARHARPTNRLAPDRQPLGRIIGRKRSRFKRADTQYLQAAIGLTTCVACNCCCLSPVRSTHDVSFAFTGLVG